MIHKLGPYFPNCSINSWDIDEHCSVVYPLRHPKLLEQLWQKVPVGLAFECERLRR